MIIYPPFIADTIPGFSTDKIIIPFQQNPAVSKEEFEDFGFKLLIKDFQSSKELTTLNSSSYNIEKGIATFEFNKEIWEPTTGQYYKFQIAYNDGSDYFAYSSASIGRCVAGDTIDKPVIKQLTDNIININTTGYTGEYKTSLLSEPVYSYRFVLKEHDTGKIIQDTGNVKHNVDSDLISSSKRTSAHNFKIRYELEPLKVYSLVYSVTTVNNYTISSDTYYIAKAGELPTSFIGELLVTQDRAAKENGYLILSLSSNNPVRGNFIIERTSDGYEWNQLTEFSLTKITNLTNFTWKDWSVEQGIKYTYAIRQKYEEAIADTDFKRVYYSERICSKPIEVDFEDMFLSDGKRQLKIKYNPKVSSFKNTILETKTDTIGSQYPFFFRNNDVKYKEIPISGLISYLMDENEMFMTTEELGLDKMNNAINLTEKAFSTLCPRTTNLENYNYAAERKFKLEVLEWLTNGELKLFRSPAEGNYVVRLMNTSLSPNDTLGRMLHTFSSTGYEVADHDVETLLERELINFPWLSDPVEKIYKTLDLNWYINETPTLSQKEGYVVFSSASIENVNWYCAVINLNLPIYLDDVPFINYTGIFTTPSGAKFTKIEIPYQALQNGDSVRVECMPAYTEAELGHDEFADMVTKSEDIIFSAPVGRTLWGTEDNKIDGILEAEDAKELKIYKTYVLVACKDLNATPNQNFTLTFTDTVSGKITDIDCSDGQIRYYYNIDPTIRYEKGNGLHLDIYARLESGASSALGQFILGLSVLGGAV